jgi:two-component system sensor histidine kinase BaeS
MKIRLATGLSALFILISLLSVVITYAIVNTSFQKLFSDYSIQRQEKKNEQVAGMIAGRYQHAGRWEKDMVQDLGVGFLDEGLIVKVSDMAGLTVWDARDYNNGICQAMIDKASIDMRSRYPSINGGLTEKTYPVTWENRDVGRVEIGYYGPFYYSDIEFLFLGTINTVLIWVAVGTSLLAGAAGIFAARRMSQPLAGVAGHTMTIAGGRYDEKILKRSAIVEIDELIGSVNRLTGELEKQERSKKELTQSVAHELRTPLATLQAQIEALIDGVWKTTPKRLRDMHEEILRLTGLVATLETLSRYDAENMPLATSLVRPRLLIEKALRLFGAQLKAKRITAVVTGTSGEIKADADKLLQVFINLLSNSLAHTAAGGRIDISVRGKKDRRVIQFQDSGRGIAAGDLPHVFERFYRADKSRSRHTGGSGLGLAIVDAIIKAHGGTIIVKSARGKGTKFIITLPVK